MCRVPSNRNYIHNIAHQPHASFSPVQPAFVGRYARLVDCCRGRRKRLCHAARDERGRQHGTDRRQRSSTSRYLSVSAVAWRSSLERAPEPRKHRTETSQIADRRHRRQRRQRRRKERKSDETTTTSHCTHLTVFVEHLLHLAATSSVCANCCQSAATHRTLQSPTKQILQVYSIRPLFASAVVVPRRCVLLVVVFICCLFDASAQCTGVCV